MCFVLFCKIIMAYFRQRFLIPLTVHRHMTLSPLTITDDFSAFTKFDGMREAGLIVVADHAKALLPPAYGSLGLCDQQFARHIAYDIGIEGVVRHLNALMNVPVVMANFSRLLIDPNRGEDDPTLVMRLSDGAVIPENAAID